LGYLAFGALVIVGLVGLAFAYTRSVWLAFRDKDRPF